MCVVDLEPCSVWRETPHKARKVHRCDCCETPIVVGEYYLSHFSIFEGDTVYQSMCFACWLAREQFADAHYGLKSNPGFFPEMLRECIDDSESSSLWRELLEQIRRRALVSAKTQWRVQ